MTFRVKKQFENSEIRDKEKNRDKKIRDLRDSPCEEIIRKFGTKKNPVTSETLRVKNK